MKAIDRQEGGSHYKDMAIQPVQFIHANSIGYFEGCAIKYLSRWKAKNGLEDLRKAIHFIELLIELEQAKEGRWTIPIDHHHPEEHHERTTQKITPEGE